MERARDRLETLFEYAPSLRKKLPDELPKAWKEARIRLLEWRTKLEKIQINTIFQKSATTPTKRL